MIINDDENHEDRQSLSCSSTCIFFLSSYLMLLYHTLAPVDNNKWPNNGFSAPRLNYLLIDNWSSAL